MAVRTIVIQRNQAGQLVADVLESTLRVVRAAVIQYLRQGKVRLAGHPCQVPGRRVAPDSVLRSRWPTSRNRSRK